MGPLKCKLEVRFFPDLQLMLSLLPVSLPLQGSPSHSIWMCWNVRTVKPLLNIRTFSTKWRTTITTSRAQTASSASHTMPVWTPKHLLQSLHVTKMIEALYVFLPSGSEVAAGSRTPKPVSITSLLFVYLFLWVQCLSSTILVQSNFTVQLDYTSILKSTSLNHFQPVLALRNQSASFLVVTKAEGGCC